MTVHNADLLHLYRSRPQYVQAVQWTGNNHDEVRAFLGGKARWETPDDLRILAGKDGAQEWVPVPVGHWTVHPPNDLSDIWPVDPDYFGGKYDAAANGRTGAQEAS